MKSFDERIRIGIENLEDFLSWAEEGLGSDYDELISSIRAYTDDLKEYISTDFTLSTGKNCAEHFETATGILTEKLRLIKKTDRPDGTRASRLLALKKEFSRHKVFALQISSGIRAAKLLRKMIVNDDRMDVTDDVIDSIGFCGHQPSSEQIQTFSSNDSYIYEAIDYMLWICIRLNQSAEESDNADYKMMLDRLTEEICTATPSIQESAVSLILRMYFLLQKIPQSEDRDANMKGLSSLKDRFEGTTMATFIRLTINNKIQI